MKHRILILALVLVSTQASAQSLSEPGQSLFAALREVVSELEARPETDWSQVNIDALRQHLVQMDLLFSGAEVSSDLLPKESSTPSAANPMSWRLFEPWCPTIP